MKPHTVGKWRRLEDWDTMRMKIDRRAAEVFAERIATDRVTMNESHFRLWQVVLGRLADDLKTNRTVDLRELDRVTSIVEKVQRGQRLARGMALDGETEAKIRAESGAEVRRLIDTFVDVIKETVPDEETRERIRQAILRALPEEADDGTGQPQDQVA